MHRQDGWWDGGDGGTACQIARGPNRSSRAQVSKVISDTTRHDWLDDNLTLLTSVTAKWEAEEELLPLGGHRMEGRGGQALPGRCVFFAARNVVRSRSVSFCHVTSEMRIAGRHRNAIQGEHTMHRACEMAKHEECDRMRKREMALKKCAGQYACSSR